jgi:hypothetical protein
MLHFREGGMEGGASSGIGVFGWLERTHSTGRLGEGVGCRLLIFDIIAKNDELPILRYLGEAVVTTLRE